MTQKLKPITIRVPHDLDAWVRARQDETGKSFSEVVIEVLYEQFNAQTDPQAISASMADEAASSSSANEPIQTRAIIDELIAVLRSSVRSELLLMQLIDATVSEAEADMIFDQVDRDLEGEMRARE